MAQSKNKKYNPEKLKTRWKKKQKDNTIYVRHHYGPTNTNNVNKTWSEPSYQQLEVKTNRKVNVFNTCPFINIFACKDSLENLLSFT